MEIRQLRTFMSIVSLGSFSEAARQLGYTQSSVTSHIQLLEKELGVSLFERMGHALMLTAEGERLYGYAEQITRLDDEAHAALSQQVEPIGTLNLGMSESIATYHLGSVLAEYALLYPQVKMRLRLGTGNYFQSLLRKNLLDLALFIEEKVPDKDLTVHNLWTEPIVLVAAVSHPLAKVDRMDEKLLAGQTLIVTEQNSRYSTLLEEEMEKSGVEPLRMLEIGQIQAAKSFALRGLGLALLPQAAVEDEVKQGLLKILPWQGKNWNMHAYMVHHKDKWLSRPMKLFMKLLWERIPGEAGKEGRHAGANRSKNKTGR